jgi:ferritin-like metal-binding protein YciE
MATTQRDDVITWLRDAHAMETSHADNIEHLIGIADDYPLLKTKLRHHADFAKRQCEEIEAELKRLGADTSMLKDLAMKVGGWLQPLTSKLTSDTVPKNCLAAFAYENFEIASYRSLLGAAEELSLLELSAMCKRFIAEEQAMADFLFEQLPGITQSYLKRRAA